MYPVKLGYSEAIKRINQLLANGHSAEALLTSVFTFEKTLRRSLKYCIVARGFTSGQADEIIGKRGFEELGKMWKCFSPNYTALPVFVGKKWQDVPPAVTMRNKLAHGIRVYDLAACNDATTKLLDALTDFQAQLIKDVGFDGWSRIKIRRTSKLGWHP